MGSFLTQQRQRRKIVIKIQIYHKDNTIIVNLGLAEIRGIVF